MAKRGKGALEGETGNKGPISYLVLGGGGKGGVDRKTPCLVVIDPLNFFVVGPIDIPSRLALFFDTLMTFHTVVLALSIEHRNEP